MAIPYKKLFKQIISTAIDLQLNIVRKNGPTLDHIESDLTRLGVQVDPLDESGSCQKIDINDESWNVWDEAEAPIDTLFSTLSGVLTRDEKEQKLLPKASIRIGAQQKKTGERYLVEVSGVKNPNDAVTIAARWVPPLLGITPVVIVAKDTGVVYDSVEGAWRPRT